MQLFIFLHDNEGVCHDYFRIEFDDEVFIFMDSIIINRNLFQTTLRQLEEKIHLKWKINEEDQQLFFYDGNVIFGFSSDSILLQIGLKHMDKIIVVSNFDIYSLPSNTWT